MSGLPERLFVTGTGTDVGKTVVSALLMAGRGGRYWKPVQSGTTEGTDSDAVRRMADLAKDAILPEAYRFAAPLSPHEAAALEGEDIDPAHITLPPQAADGPLIVEGAGGLLVPIAPDFLMADLAAALGLPVLIVATSGLGTINHTLLTLNELKRRGLPVAGVVMNGEPNAANREAIETYGKTSVVAEIPPLADLSPHTLREAYRRAFTA